MKLYTKILIGMVAGTIVGIVFNAMSNMDRFNAIDTDNNSRISWVENQNASSEKQIAADSTAFQQLDANSDNQISPKEFKKEFGWQRFSIYTDWIGRLFINLVKMLVVPLVLVSLILGAASLGDIRKVGQMGGKAFGFFLVTTMIAAMIGIGIANVTNPGKGLPEQQMNELRAEYQNATEAKTQTDDAKEFRDKSAIEKIFDLIVSMVPSNPFKAFAEGDMLGVIFFALFLGICITIIPPEKAAPLIKGFDGLNDAVIKMVTLAMEFAPYGVFALMLSVVSDLGIDILLLLLKYALTLIVGLILHICITHFSIIAFYLRKSPLLFIRAVKEALIFGFSTSSSSATLPISMNVAQKNLGVSKEVSSFVLPLGATINMDGTAVYQAIAAIFIAQVYGIDLTFIQQLTIILTATLASVGAAGVPSAGMITLALVLATLGVPEAGIAMIFGLDRFLDMCRTIVNITGDLTLSMVMAKTNGEEINIQLDKDMIPG